MPAPVITGCGGPGQDPCPPVNAIVESLANVLLAMKRHENGRTSTTRANLDAAISEARDLINPYILPEFKEEFKR